MNDNDKRNGIYLRLKHGLGDQMEFQIVVRHLQRDNPGSKVWVESPVGTGDCYPMADEWSSIAYPYCNWGYKLSKYIGLGRTEENYAWVPSTKATRCLVEEFGYILHDIDPDLFKYEVKISEEQRSQAAKAYAGITGRICLIHYEGVASPEMKNLSHSEVEKLRDTLVARGFTPVILDWSGRIPVDCAKLKLPTIKGHNKSEAGLIAAAIEYADLFIGIDSGPLHVAGATNTPTIGIWKKFWPGYNISPCPNMAHVVPSTHLGGTDLHIEPLVQKWAGDQLAVWEKRYNYVYVHEDSVAGLIEMIEELDWKEKADFIPAFKVWRVSEAPEEE